MVVVGSVVAVFVRQLLSEVLAVVGEAVVVVIECEKGGATASITYFFRESGAGSRYSLCMGCRAGSLEVGWQTTIGGDRLAEELELLCGGGSGGGGGGWRRSAAGGRICEDCVERQVVVGREDVPKLKSGALAVGSALV